MLIQLTLDMDFLDRALELAGKVSEWIDIMEVDAPLIKTYGAEAIRKSFPGHLVSADMKTMDGGEYAASLAFGAGADITVVMACAERSTIENVIDEAQKNGKRETLCHGRRRDQF